MQLFLLKTEANSNILDMKQILTFVVILTLSLSSSLFGQDGMAQRQNLPPDPVRRDFLPTSLRMPWKRPSPETMPWEPNDWSTSRAPNSLPP